MRSLVVDTGRVPWRSPTLGFEAPTRDALACRAASLAALRAFEICEKEAADFDPVGRGCFDRAGLAHPTAVSLLRNPPTDPIRSQLLRSDPLPLTFHRCLERRADPARCTATDVIRTPIPGMREELVSYSLSCGIFRPDEGPTGCEVSLLDSARTPTGERGNLVSGRSCAIDVTALSQDHYVVEVSGDSSAAPVRIDSWRRPSSA